VCPSRTRREKFSGHDENCPQNASDLEGSPVTSSRPAGRPQKRPDNRTSNDSVAAQAADGSQRTTGAADEQCPRSGISILYIDNAMTDFHLRSGEQRSVPRSQICIDIAHDHVQRSHLAVPGFYLPQHNYFCSLHL